MESMRRSFFVTALMVIVAAACGSGGSSSAAHTAAGEFRAADHRYEAQCRAFKADSTGAYLPGVDGANSEAAINAFFSSEADALRRLATDLTDIPLPPGQEARATHAEQTLAHIADALPTGSAADYSDPVATQNQVAAADVTLQLRTLAANLGVRLDQPDRWWSLGSRCTQGVADIEAQLKAMAVGCGYATGWGSTRCSPYVSQ